MGCGKMSGGAAASMFTGGIFGMAQDDPQNLPGQGLMRADNYNGAVAANEYAQLIAAYQAQVPRQFDVDAEYIPKYNQIYSDAALDAAGQASGALRRMYDVDLDGNVTDLGYLPEIRADMVAANPETARLMALLNEQAEGDLMAGTRLTPEELRFAQQSSRAAMAARGMSGSNMAVADEILRTYDLGQNRLNQRRQFASGVVGLNQSVYQSPMLAYLAMSQQNAANRGNAALGFGGMTAGSASNMLRSQPGMGLLNNIYAQNQQNNRLTAENETRMAEKFVDSQMSVIGMGSRGMMGGGGGGRGM